LLGGDPKTGKSLLTTEIGICVASGEKFLGTYLPEQGDVLYMNYDDYTKRLVQRCDVIRCGDRDLKSFHLTSDLVQSNEGGYEFIRRWCEEVEKPKLVIIDIIDIFKSDPPRKTTEKKDWAMFFNEIKGITDEYGVSFLLIAHKRKPNDKVPVGNPFHAIYGSVGIIGGTDTNMVLESTQADNVYNLKVQGNDIPECYLQYTLEIQSGRWVEVQGDPLTEGLKNTKKKIVEFVRSSTEPVATGVLLEQIGKLCGVKERSIKKHLAELVENGYLERPKKGFYTMPDAGLVNRRKLEEIQDLLDGECPLTADMCATA